VTLLEDNPPVSQNVYLGFREDIKEDISYLMDCLNEVEQKQDNANLHETIKNQKVIIIALEEKQELSVPAHDSLFGKHQVLMKRTMVIENVIKQMLHPQLVEQAIDAAK